MLNLTIFKFGGTSVGNAESISTIPQILKSSTAERKLVVVSAQSGITNLLIDLAHGIDTFEAIATRLQSLCEELNIDTPTEVATLLNKLKEEENEKLPPSQKVDAIASYGERFSIHIIRAYLASCGINATPVDSRDIIVTDSTFGNAKYVESATTKNANDRLAPLFDKQLIPVVTGYIAQDEQGRTTTLGRGGSDLTATILASALNAISIEIWTDVDGIMSADPKIVPQAQVIDTFSYEEAFELSNWGARVMYNNSLKPAYLASIPIQVKNTFNPQASGTKITNKQDSSGFSIATKDDEIILTIYNPSMIGTSGYLGEFFSVFAALRISVDIIAVSEASVSLTTDTLDAKLIAKLKEAIAPFGKLSIKKNCSIVALVSKKLRNNQGIIADCTKILHEANIAIEMISFGNSEINISFVIAASDKLKALTLLHSHFIAKLKS